jgi:hypothetical protein
MAEYRTPRRSFLAALLAAAGGGALAPLFPHARLHAAELSDQSWDLSWLDDLKGKHKQVFDVDKVEDVPGPLHVVKNYLDAWRDVYHLEFPEVNTVVGIAGGGFPINAGDALWAKYKLATRWHITDDTGKAGVTRNPFLESSDPKRASVKSLQARGTVFFQCNNALRNVSIELAMASKAPVDSVYAELVAGLNPGVRLVPARTMALGLTQEHGCAYEFL